MFMKKVIIVISLVLFGLIYGCKYEVFQWRGTDRNGIYQETGLLDQWPDNGPFALEQAVLRSVWPTGRPREDHGVRHQINK